MAKSKEEKKSEESRLFLFSSLSILAIVLIVLIVLHSVRISSIDTADRTSSAQTGSALVGMAHQTAQPYGLNFHTAEATYGPCSDTDGGKNFQKYGRVSGIVDGKRVVINDECINSDTLKEAYCLDKGSHSVPSVEYASCSGLYGKSAFCVRGRCTR